MDYITEFIEKFLGYMSSGGFVMWPLAILVAILWYALGYRYYILNRGSRKSVRNLIRKIHSGKRTKVKGMMDIVILKAFEIEKKYKDRVSVHELRSYMDDAFYPHLVEIKRFSRLIMVIVAAAPLIGLLGTVVGMIETFDSLASASLFSQSGGIAGGISQALFTTQLGLVVAVPGLIIGRLLERKANKMELELEQVKDIICSQGVLDEI